MQQIPSVGNELKEAGLYGGIKFTEPAQPKPIRVLILEIVKEGIATHTREIVFHNPEHQERYQKP